MSHREWPTVGDSGARRAPQWRVPGSPQHRLSVVPAPPASSRDARGFRSGPATRLSSRWAGLWG